MKALLPKDTTVRILICLALIPFISCGHKTQVGTEIDSLSVDTDSVQSTVVDTIVTETQSANIDSRYASVSVTMTLPVGDGVAQTIRQSLLTLMRTQVYKDADYDGEGTLRGKAFAGDTKNLKAVCNFYCKSIFRPIEKQSREEYASDSVTYEQDITLSKVCEAANYIVFNDMSYGSRGGAHGGMSGYGYIVFNRQTGQLVKTIIKPESAKKMQRLLKDGFKRYFKDSGEDVPSDKTLMEMLSLPEGSNIIPLPQFNGIAPAKDGLSFVYSQYEIGPYALGMPSFTIPYDKVRSFMTDEALELIK